MKTASFMATALALAIVPSLTSVACDKKENAVPVVVVASATVAPPQATAAAPITATPPPVTQPAAPAAARPALARADGGSRDAAVAAVSFDASAVAFPTGMPSLPSLPTLQPSALPAIASGIVGGILNALPSGLVPPPPAPSK